MFTQAEVIVVLWFLPVLLHIILPLTVLFFWLLTKPFREGHLTKPAAQAEPKKSNGIGFGPVTAAKI